LFFGEGFDSNTTPLNTANVVRRQVKSYELFRIIQKEYAGPRWAERAKDEINCGYGTDFIESNDVMPKLSEAN